MYKNVDIKSGLILKYAPRILNADMMVMEN